MLQSIREKKFIFRNFKILNDKIKKKLKNAIENSDENTIHKLRLAFKKIKASFILLENLDHRFNSNNLYKPYKKISKNSGAARDLQIQLKIAEEMERDIKYDLCDWRMGLKRKLRKKLKRLKKRCVQFNSRIHKTTSDKVTRTIKGIPPELLKKNIVSYFKDLNSKIIELNKRSFIEADIKKIHDFRKRLKEFKYNKELLKYSHIKIVTKYFNQRKSMEDILGRLHDYRIIIQRINSQKKKIAKWKVLHTELEKRENLCLRNIKGRLNRL